MKKNLICSIALLLAALFVLSACSGSVPAVETTPSPSPEPTAEPVAASAPVETAEPVEEDPLPDVDITSWEFIVANMYTYIGRYSPPVTTFYTPQLLDNRIVDQARALIAAAAEDGYNLYNYASFRNFDFYENHHNDLCSILGSASEAVKVWTPGGCSDHSTGLAIDFTDVRLTGCSYSYDPAPDFIHEEAFQWLLDNAADYGFVQRYIEGKEEYYGLACNSRAHFRYVGVEAAKYMKEHNLCLEEFVALYQ